MGKKQFLLVAVFLLGNVLAKDTSYRVASVEPIFTTVQGVTSSTKNCNFSNSSPSQYNNSNYNNYSSNSSTGGKLVGGIIGGITGALLGHGLAGDNAGGVIGGVIGTLSGAYLGSRVGDNKQSQNNFNQNYNRGFNNDSPANCTFSNQYQDQTKFVGFNVRFSDPNGNISNRFLLNRPADKRYTLAEINNLQ